MVEIEELRSLAEIFADDANEGGHAFEDWCNDYLKQLGDAKFAVWLKELQYYWPFWGRPKQFAPPGDWSVWMNRYGRGSGKALALDTPIPTPDGWTTMGAIRVGSTVFDERGFPCVVTFATPVQIDRQCYRVRFDDGTSIVADAEHRWLTWDHGARKSAGRCKDASDPRRKLPRIRETREIASTVRYSGREHNHSIPLTGALECPVATLPVAPYVLGAWLGDGTSASAEITIGDSDAEEMLALLAQDGECVTGVVRRKMGARCATYPIGGLPKQRDPRTGRMIGTLSLHSRLRSLGVLKNKHIPSSYLRASAEQRLALLRGLMDTDGSADKGRNNSVEFCTTRAALAVGILELARSLGLKATCIESRATLRGRDVGPRWKVTWSSRLPVFRLRRKRDRSHPNAAQRTRTTHRYIVAVEPVNSVPVRCITVDSPSHLYLAGHGFVATHNTRTGSEWTRQRAMEHPGRNIALIGKTTADVRDYMIEGKSGLLRISPPNERPLFEPSKRRVTWPNGTWATIYVSEDPDQIRGFSGDTAWVDEMAKFTNPGEVWDNLQFALREVSEDRPRTCITTTYQPKPILDAIEEMPSTVTVWGSSFENRSNLAPEWLDETLTKYKGTKLEGPEILGHKGGDVEGLVYSSFSNKPFPKGNIDESVVDIGGEILIGIDFNVNPMSAVIGQRVVDECHILDALQIPCSSTEELASEIKRRYPNRRLVACPDPAGAYRNSSQRAGMTDFKILRAAGFEVRVAGVITDDNTPPAAHCAVIDRQNNTNAMLLQGERRRIRIHPRAKAIIASYKGLCYKEGTRIPDGRSGLQHMADAGDYLLWELFNVYQSVGSWGSSSWST